MNAASLKVTTKNTCIGVLAILTLLFFSSCARKVAFLSSSVVPAARGYIQVKKDNNHNFVIQIHLLNLAETKRLQPAKAIYVVWMESGQEAAKNIGQINSSTGLLSNKLKATFETVSSFKPSRIFITAEDDGNIQYPDMKIILTSGSL